MKAATRWYYVTAGSNSGYIRSDLVKDITWSNTAAVSTDSLNYRTGPDTSYKLLGTTGVGAPLTLLLPAYLYGSKSSWYKVSVNSKTAYVSAEFIKLGTSLFIQKSAKDLEGKSDLAKALLINPTRGGNSRVIYTFTPDNCIKRFAIKGYKRAKVPQGFTFNGSSYYIVYASSHSGIRAYTSDGRFTHQKVFPRCKPGYFHYIQDCGAGEGFIFHGVSGKNKKARNQIDIYRAADMAYLGSIAISIGEYESAVVGPGGYLELLINTSGNTDYIWRTPLNINELK